MSSKNKEQEQLDVQLKEQLGRNKYELWLSTKPECQHECYTKDQFAVYDCLFFSAGTLILAEIKNRNYNYSFLDRHGAEVDAKKARAVYKAAKRLQAHPVIITCTQDGQFIISDLTKARFEHVSWQWRQTNDFTHYKSWCETLNLSACTIN